MSNLLNSAARSDLAQASPAGVAQVFAGLQANFPLKRWLGSSNAYVNDCINQIDADLAPGSPGVNSTDLASYIAASIPLHCMDGWSFLARSMNCYIDGCPHQAAHFAYYAELRAAMSILASRGIGVFSARHFVVDAAGNCIRVRGGGSTHKFAWQALDFWANLPNSGADLLTLFVVSGHTIRSWFQHRPGLPVAASLASEWLKEWGLDLSVMGNDHLLRNSGSYRPNYLSPLQTDARCCSEFLRELWKLFEPSTSRFELLDRQLLRLLIRKTFENTGKKANAKSSAYRAHLTGILSGIGISDPMREIFRQFFSKATPEPQVLLKAATLGLPHEINAHERVMARAALLLRVASGFTAQLIDGSAFNMLDLSFWTSSIAERRAFWEPGQPLSNLTDLWQDVSEAIQAEEDWIAGCDLQPLPMFKWRWLREGPLRPLSEFDRVGLWGLSR